jgi:hypothetical protein
MQLGKGAFSNIILLFSPYFFDFILLLFFYHLSFILFNCNTGIQLRASSAPSVPLREEEDEDDSEPVFYSEHVMLLPSNSGNLNFLFGNFLFGMRNYRWEGEFKISYRRSENCGVAN